MGHYISWAGHRGNLLPQGQVSLLLARQEHAACLRQQHCGMEGSLWAPRSACGCLKEELTGTVGPSLTFSSCMLCAQHVLPRAWTFSTAECPHCRTIPEN